MRLNEIAAISLDLDDTLWPFAPAVARAERVLYSWLIEHAPATAAILDGPETLQRLRKEVESQRPDLEGNLRALRLESIRMVLDRAGADSRLAAAAYEVFIAQRQRVELFDDVVPALDRLSRRYPLVAVTNGNTDLKAVGIESFFRATIAATNCCFAKPDPRIFQTAAAIIGVANAQLLHVGDDLLLDVDGAMSAGLRAAWLRRETSESMGRERSKPDLIVGDLWELCEVFGIE